MTESVRDQDCGNAAHGIEDNIFGHPCSNCGEIVMFADDATYQIANRRRTQNQEKII